MLSDQIEQLRKRYTGQYVKADSSRADLARFQDAVGQVKTVNMNGRALVQFDQGNDRAWHDIPLDCLTIVDKPAPKPEPAKDAAKAAASQGPAAKPSAVKSPAAKSPAAKPEPSLPASGKE